VPWTARRSAGRSWGTEWVHAGGAVRVGLLTPVEVREAILRLAPYLGYPRVRHALVWVSALIDEIDG